MTAGQRPSFELFKSNKKNRHEEKETRQLSDPHLKNFKKKIKNYQQQQPSVNSAADAATTAQ
jgi:hypothetical protein